MVSWCSSKSLGILYIHHCRLTCSQDFFRRVFLPYINFMKILRSEIIIQHPKPSPLCLRLQILLILNVPILFGCWRSSSIHEFCWWHFVIVLTMFCGWLATKFFFFFQAMIYCYLFFVVGYFGEGHIYTYPA